MHAWIVVHITRTGPKPWRNVFFIHNANLVTEAAFNEEVCMGVLRCMFVHVPLGFYLSQLSPLTTALAPCRRRRSDGFLFTFNLGIQPYFGF